MENTTPTKANPSDAGCWIDGHWGQYGPTRLIEIAQAHGMALDADEQAAIEAYHSNEEHFIGTDGTENDTFEWVVGQGGIADDAEEWMNTNIAPEGHSFGWLDGEWFLASTEWWEEASF